MVVLWILGIVERMMVMDATVVGQGEGSRDGQVTSQLIEGFESHCIDLLIIDILSFKIFS